MKLRTLALGTVSLLLSVAALAQNSLVISPTAVTASGTITSTAPSGHAGMLSLPGNTTNQAIPANQFAIGGFSSTSATAYGWQPGTTAPAANQVMAVGALVSGWAPITYISNATTVNGQTCTLGSTCSSVVANPTLTAQAANLSATTIYTTPAAAHYYDVCIELDLTRAATTSSVLPGLQVDYTSAVDGIVRVANLGFSSSNTGNATYLQNSGCVPIYVQASSTIQWATVNYGSVGGTTMQYSMEGSVRLVK
jgi:hypothetical protein